jgi:hypothetical protein
MGKGSETWTALSSDSAALSFTLIGYFSFLPGKFPGVKFSLGRLPLPDQPTTSGHFLMISRSGSNVEEFEIVGVEVVHNMSFPGPQMRRAVSRSEG